MRGAQPRGGDQFEVRVLVEVLEVGPGVARLVDEVERRVLVRGDC